MDRTTSKTVEAQIIQKYRKLHRVLRGLVDDLQVLEPGGTLMENTVIPLKEGGTLEIGYSATPIVLAFAEPNKKTTIRVMETGDEA